MHHTQQYLMLEDVRFAYRWRYAKKAKKRVFFGDVYDAMRKICFGLFRTCDGWRFLFRTCDGWRFLFRRCDGIENSFRRCDAALIGRRQPPPLVAGENKESRNPSFLLGHSRAEPRGAENQELLLWSLESGRQLFNSFTRLWFNWRGRRDS